MDDKTELPICYIDHLLLFLSRLSGVCSPGLMINGVPDVGTNIIKKTLSNSFWISAVCSTHDFLGRPATPGKVCQGKRAFRSLCKNRRGHWPQEGPRPGQPPSSSCSGSGGTATWQRSREGSNRPGSTIQKRSWPIVKQFFFGMTMSGFSQKKLFHRS